MELLSIGYYKSPLGGADHAHRIQEGDCIVELITGGRVYNPSETVLKDVGSVFIHVAGENTVYRSLPEEHYECLTALYAVKETLTNLSEFHWSSPQAALVFSDEMLSSFHRLEMDREILGHHVWSTLMFQQEQYKLKGQGKTYPAIIVQALDWIDHHYRESLSMDDWAKALSMSTSHFQSIFKKVVGVTPYQHVIDLRMRAARQDLVSSNESIKRIASNLGFSNVENFCRSFKKNFNKTAAEYRKSYRMLDG